MLGRVASLCLQAALDTGDLWQQLTRFSLGGLNIFCYLIRPWRRGGGSLGPMASGLQAGRRRLPSGSPGTQLRRRPLHLTPIGPVALPPYTVCTGLGRGFTPGRRPAGFSLVYSGRSPIESFLTSHRIYPGWPSIGHLASEFLRVPPS